MANEFKIRQIYLKDASFQAPGGAAAFSQEWKPERNVDIKITSDTLTDSLYEVNLTVTVVTRSVGQTAFMVEIVQSGVFTITGYDEAQRHRIIHVICADVLYPYAREAVEGLITRGRFPAFFLEPIDFGATYAGQ
jgi:preprotein translocase subunit SecB